MNRMEPLDALKTLADALRQSQAKVLQAVGGEPFAGYSEQMKVLAGALDNLQGELAPRPAPPASAPAEPQKAHVSAPAAMAPDLASMPEPVVAALVKMARITDGDVVCHLGCGDGRLLVRAASLHHVRGVGIDADSSNIDAAREKIRKARLQHLLTVQAGDPPRATSPTPPSCFSAWASKTRTC